MKIQTTQFLNQEILNQEISSISNDILNLIEQNKINILLSRKKYVYNTENMLNFLTTLNFKNKKSSKVLLSILKDACFKAELTSSLSIELMLPFVCSILKNIEKFKDNTYLKNELNKLVENTEKELPFFISYPTNNNIKSITNNLVEKKLSNMIMEAFKLSGIEGKIFIEGTKNNIDSVELLNGYNFKLKTFDIINHPQKRWHKNNVKCVVIDGIVANVHEIDQLLTKSSETKVPLIIFAKGFENEILTTIKTNNDRKTFNILPVKVDLEIESLNIINDIAVVCGTDIVSTLKGNALSLINYDELPTVDYISCYRNSVLIKNEKSEKRIRISIKELIKAREKQTDETLIKLFNNRIKSLTSNFVVIKMSSSSEQERLKKIEKMDECLRTVQSVLKAGTFNSENAEKFCKNMEKHNIDYLVLNALRNSFPKEERIYPATSIASFLKYGISLINSITSIYGAILLDR